MVLLLGASQFPELPQQEDNEAFKNSADAVLEYFSSQRNGPAVYRIENLFDCELSVIDQGRRIRTFLQKNCDASDLIIYYIGHGGFLQRQDYFLALRHTGAREESLTGLRVSALAEIVKGEFGGRGRVYVILDCCFAGEAVREFQATGLGLVIEGNTFQQFPSSGTALLVASSKDQPAVSPRGRRYTMFSECLLEVLKEGVRGSGPLLTLQVVADQLRALVNARFGGDAVVPEIHSPLQEAGQSVARMPLFWNAAYVAASLPDHLIAELGDPLPKVRAKAVESLQALLDADGEIVGLVISELARIVADDDSRLVIRLAAEALKSRSTPAAAAGPPAATLEQPEDNYPSAPPTPGPAATADENPLSPASVGEVSKVAGEVADETEGSREAPPDAEAALTVQVQPSQRRVLPDSQVTWTCTVSNTGPIAVRAIEVTDAAGTQLCSPFDLEPGEEQGIKFVNHYRGQGGRMVIAALGRADHEQLVSAEGGGRVTVRKPKAHAHLTTTPFTTPSATPLASTLEVALRRTRTFGATPLAPVVDLRAGNASLDLTDFREALRQVKYTAKLGDPAINRLIRLIGEGEHHYHIATRRRAQPPNWTQRVVDWAAEVATVGTGEVVMVKLDPPSPRQIVEYIDRLAEHIAAATAVRIPTTEFVDPARRSVQDAL